MSEASKSSWEYFRDQAKQDFESSKTLYEKGDFGNSAYLLQQTLEKQIKAVVFKYNLYDGSARDLGHMPLNKLWVIFMDQTKSEIRNSPHPFMRKALMDFQTVAKLIGKFFQDTTKGLMEEFWKESLEIPSNSKTKLTDYKNKLKEKTRQLLNIFEMHKDVFDRIKFSETRLPKEAYPQVQKILELMNSSDLERSNVVSQINGLDVANFPSKISPTIADLLEVCLDSNDVGLKDFYAVIFLTWIFTFQHLVFLTFPHESIGRYPRTINGQNSRLLYKKHAKSLKKLSMNVETVCERLTKLLNKS